MSAATMVDAIADAMVATKPVKPVVVVKSDFQVGWDLYAAGAADSDCATPEQVRGWWHALDADCTGEMCSVLAADCVDSFEMDEVLQSLHDMGQHGW